MKRLIPLVLAIALVPTLAYAQSFSAVLSGAREVPGPGDADGTGLAVFSVSGTTINYSVLVQGIGAPTAAHIHRGAAGASGDPVVTLDVNALANGAASGLTQSLVSEIAGNPSGFYVNVHTGEFPNGAIRGQLSSGTTDGATTASIPVVGKVAGVNNTNFVTDLRIVNTASATASVKLDYFGQSAAGQSVPTATKTVTVAPSQQLVLDDVVGATLESSGLGGLQITADQSVVAVARVINDLRAQGLGTTGFSFNAAEEAPLSGTLTFLISNNDYRTNVGYFNAGSSAVNATFTARRTLDGSVLGSRTISIPSRAMVQQGAFQLVDTVAEAERTQENYYITWSADAPLFVYGSVVDNKTGDSVLVQ